MKRIAAFLVALLLIATCTVYVSAAGTTAVMSSAEAQIGDTVVLTVTIANAPETNVMSFKVSLPEGIKLVDNMVDNPDYDANDPDCEEDPKINETRWTKGKPMTTDINVEDGVGAWVNGNETKKRDVNGKVVQLSFKVEETATCGENEIDFVFYVDDSAEKDANVTETAGVITIPHTWADELTNTDAEGHYYACEGDCGEKKDFEEHGFDMSCDETCDECGYTRTEVEHDFSETLVNDDPEGHYYECACGAKNGEAEHVYDYDCDAICNDCGFEREAADHQPVGDVQYDNDGHWGECACGEQIDKKAHEFEYDCDTTCEHCNHTREAEHDFSDMAVFDETHHWFECMYECGEIDGKVEHTYDQEIEEDEYFRAHADCTTPATYYKSCVCGYCNYDDNAIFEVGEIDEDAHVYYYDYETGIATCIICEDDKEVDKGEDTTEIEGAGATVTAPEGVLGDKMEVEVEDVTDDYAGEDFGDITGEEEYEGYAIVSMKGYALTVEGALADLVTGMTFTVDIPEGRFTDVQLYAPEEIGFEYVDNGDGTVTFTVTDEFVDYMGGAVLPVIFIGKPVPSGTSDNGLTALWIAVLAIAVLGVVATAYYSKKKATK